MLRIEIPKAELWDEREMEFKVFPGQVLVLEHSLVSVSKWESKFNKPFITKEQKTRKEMIEYVRCMTITQNVPKDAYNYLTQKNLKEIQEYIDAKMTATTFREDKNHLHNNEVVTSELIYYWMIALNIPMECEKWHLNRLFTLIRICNIKNQPGKKMSKSEIMAQHAALNAQRKRAMHTTG